MACWNLSAINANSNPAYPIDDHVGCEEGSSQGHHRNPTCTSDYAQGEFALLDNLEVYTHSEEEGDCISPCNEHFTQFVVNEFDQGSHSIKHGKYVMVTRKSMSFKGRWEWAYICSCDQVRREVLHSASGHVQQRRFP